MKIIRKKLSFLIMLLLFAFILCGAAAATSTQLNNTQISNNQNEQQLSTSTAKSTTTTSTVKLKTSSSPSTSKISLAEIKVGASNVKKFINIYKKLPRYVTLKGKQVNMASFLHLMTRATILIKTNKNASFKIPQDVLPSTTSENLNPGIVKRDSYVGLAYRVNDFMNRNGKAPVYATLNLGRASYKTQIYLFSMVLDNYRYNNTLPSSVYLTSTNKSIATSKATTTSTNYISIADLKLTATKVKSFINTNKRLPNYVTLNGKQVGMATYLHLLSRATILIFTNRSPYIKLTQDVLPSTTTEDMKAGTVKKDSYVGLAYRVNDFMNRNGKAPVYATLNLGKASYKTQIYLFSSVLDNYRYNNTLPTSISVTPFYGSVIKAGWVNISRLVYYPQPNSYSCGPSSLKMVLSAYGITATESWLESIAGTTSEDGTTHSGLINSIPTINRVYGTSFKAWDENLSTRYWTGLYSQFISKGRPVILHVKSWLSSGGHYVVLSGMSMNDQLARLADPSYGGYRIVSFADLEYRMNWITSTGRSNNPVIVVTT